ncbi:MAG: hypothetical protein LBL83_08775 [Clostridiales bacterium]|jgi:hypothetical protein|nr:hypothetical protein [Clostridiales bacterium]
MEYRLPLERVADIALLFLDGDCLESVLIDRLGHTDYDFGKFNCLKRALAQIEKIEESLGLAAILWQAYPTNDRVGAPLVAGSSLPLEGCKRQFLPPEIRAAIRDGARSVSERGGGIVSLYCPVRNSQHEIVGALELLAGLSEKIDVGVRDMFVNREPLEQEEDL